MDQTLGLIIIGAVVAVFLIWVFRRGQVSASAKLGGNEVSLKGDNRRQPTPGDDRGITVGRESNQHFQHTHCQPITKRAL